MQCTGRSAMIVAAYLMYSRDLDKCCIGVDQEATLNMIGYRGIPHLT